MLKVIQEAALVFQGVLSLPALGCLAVDHLADVLCDKVALFEDARCLPKRKELLKY